MGNINDQPVKGQKIHTKSTCTLKILKNIEGMWKGPVSNMDGQGGKAHYY